MSRHTSDPNTLVPIFQESLDFVKGWPQLRQMSTINSPSSSQPILF